MRTGMNRKEKNSERVSQLNTWKEVIILILSALNVK